MLKFDLQICPFPKHLFIVWTNLKLKLDFPIETELLQNGVHIEANWIGFEYLHTHTLSYAAQTPVVTNQ